MFFPNGNITYVELKSQITFEPEDPHALTEMKTVFREDIKSMRIEDKIKTVSALIKILEKRDVLNADNIAPLVKIYSILKKPFQYNPPYIGTSSRTPTPNIPISSNFSSSTSRISCDPEVKAKVYEKIASEIGRNWTFFARYLRLRESHIDDLSHKSSKDRIYDILCFHEENCDIRKWKTDLLNALIECRRRDLHGKVESIFDTYKS